MRVDRPDDDRSCPPHHRRVRRATVRPPVTPPAPDTPLERVLRLAGRRHGVVTRDEVLSLGVSRGQASRLVQRRILVPMWRGVYATGGVPLTPIVRLAGAVVATNGAASHVSAAWLHGLLDAPEDPEVTVNRTADGRRVGVLLHRCDDLSPQDTVVRNGIRVTDATRTCIDLGAVLSPRELERVIERARARRLINLDRLVTRFLSLSLLLVEPCVAHYGGSNWAPWQTSYR